MKKAVTKKAAKAPASVPVPNDGKEYPMTPLTRDPSTITIRQTPGEDESTAVARNALKPSLNAAQTIRAFSPQLEKHLDLMALSDVLAGEGVIAKRGDLGKGEGMLMIQAHTLDAMFRSLACRGAANMGEHLGATETYLRLAMKAQSQCRATLETLAEIKNPLAGAYVRQANVAQGHQQVNNAPPLAEGSQARENETTLNKLLEATHGERMDTGTAQKTIPAYPPVAAMDAINRPKVKGGKRGSGAKRIQGRNADNVAQGGKSAKGTSRGP